MTSVAYTPQTPSHSNSHAHSYSPHTSSPLASSSVFNSNHNFAMGPPSSPVMELRNRRQLQFKSRQSGPAHPPSSPAFSNPSSSRPRARSSRYMKPAPGSNLAPIPFALTPIKTSSSASGTSVESNQTAWMRERFKASCLKRAKKVREQKVSKGRGAPSEPNSDGADVSMDEDEEDEYKDALDDEVFQRIFATEERRKAHLLAYFCEREMGSSYDPAFEEYLENQGEEEPPEEFMYEDSEPNPDDYDFDLDQEDEYGDESWMDAYIASLPDEELEALSAIQGTGSGTPTPTATQVPHTHQFSLPSSSQPTGEAHIEDMMMD